MGTLLHHSMAVHVTMKELRRAPITMITPDTTIEGIINIIIPECILIIRMLITTVVNHVIAKCTIFVVYITMCFLSVGKGWKQKGG